MSTHKHKQALCSWLNAYVNEEADEPLFELYTFFRGKTAEERADFIRNALGIHLTPPSRPLLGDDTQPEADVDVGMLGLS